MRGIGGMLIRRNLLLLIAVLFVFLFCYPSFPSAHAYMIKSFPSEKEILTHPPQRVSIQFDETIIQIEEQ